MIRLVAGGEPQPRFLYGALGFGRRSGHPIRDGTQPSPFGIESLGQHVAFVHQLIFPGRQAAEQTQAFQAVYEDLELLEMPTPGDLARSLVLRMGGSVNTIPRERNSTARYVNELAMWLVGQLSATSRGWCWIFDGLSSPSLPPATQDFVLTLAGEARSALLRLVLLGFDGALPPGMEAFAYRKELTPIGEPEVREFFADLQGRIIDPLRIDVEAWTQAALDGLPAGPGRLGALSARLSEFADLLTDVR